MISKKNWYRKDEKHCNNRF